MVLASFSAKKGQYYSNRSRNLCFMIKTVHAGIDGLKVDTQVLKLLRILFVEHYKHTLLNNIRLILLVKVRMTYVGYVRWPGRSPLERKAIFKLSAERRAQSAERKAIFKLSAERRAQSAERRAQSAERKTHYGMA